MQELKRGYLFDYKNQTWKVTDIYKIRWDDGSNTTEYQVKNKKGEVRYLMLEFVRKQKTSYTFWEKIADINQFLKTISKTESDFVSIGKAKFPKKFQFENTMYTFDEKCDGTCYYDYESERVNSLDYTNDDDSKFLAIQLWDDEIEISTGISILQSQINNIQERTSFVSSDSLWNFISKYFVGIIFTLFMLMTFALNKCSSNSWDGNRDSNDSTKVYRNSNNYYRGRSSRGFGK